VGSDVHRIKVRAWQGLTAAANFLGSSRQGDTAEAAVKGEIRVQLPMLLYHVLEVPAQLCICTCMFIAFSTSYSESALSASSGNAAHLLVIAPAHTPHALHCFLLPSFTVTAASSAELLLQLSVNQPPSIKQYQEAIVAHLSLQHPNFLQELLLPQITSVEKGSAATGSHILIAVQVALHSPPEQQLAVLPQLLKLLLPWTNHHTHHIRTFAQLGFCALLVSNCH
jgi:hypothetical protein